MSELTLWKNQEMNKLRKDIDRLFSQLFSDFGATVFPGEAAGTPFIDLSETDDSISVKAELPGIDPENLDISVSNNRLTISGEKYEDTIENRGYYHRVERSFGSFSRTVLLPCKVKTEEIRATYKRGILYIVMPKCEPEKVRVIRV